MEKQITEEILPSQLSWILDNEVKSFVQLCLANVNKRPSADQLLHHSFFQSDGENNNLPVSICNSLFPLSLHSLLLLSPSLFLSSPSPLSLHSPFALSLPLSLPSPSFPPSFPPSFS